MLGWSRKELIGEHYRKLTTPAAVAMAEERIHRSGAVLFQPRIHEQRAALARLTGDERAWEQALREAHRLFTEMGATARAAQVARELGVTREVAT